MRSPPMTFIASRLPPGILCEATPVEIPLAMERPLVSLRATGR